MPPIGPAGRCHVLTLVGADAEFFRAPAQVSPPCCFQSSQPAGRRRESMRLDMALAIEPELHFVKEAETRPISDEVLFETVSAPP